MSKSPLRIKQTDILEEYDTKINSGEVIWVNGFVKTNPEYKLQSQLTPFEKASTLGELTKLDEISKEREK